MAVRGLCAECSAPASATCGQCGRAMCEMHFIHGSGGICLSCARGSVVG